MGTKSIEQIRRMSDAGRRNIYITQTYHELGCQLSQRGFGDDASWLLFAVWASKSAGEVIRGEDLPAIIRYEVASSTRVGAAVGQANRQWWLLRIMRLADTLTVGHLHRAIDKIVAHVSDQIGEGNLLVFEELAPVFEAMVHGQPVPPNPALEPITARYQSALTETDEKRRALMVLEANVLAVAHEQQRLQKNIACALSAPIEELLEQVLDEDLAPLVPVRFLRALARRATKELLNELSDICQVVITRTMMTLITPDGSQLRLSEDLPALPGGTLFSSPLDSADAMAALTPWDRTDGSGSPCGAANWEQIEERMCYIVNLFRSRQRLASLRHPPFTDAQLAELEAGKLPTGPL